jgi:hypothetical protein
MSLNSTNIQAEIMAASHMKVVQDKVQSVLETNKPEDVLTAIDIDMTLLCFEHPAVYYPALKKYAQIYKSIMATLTNLEKDIANTLLVNNIPLKLVEEESPEIIKGLQDQGIKLIAFTATLVGCHSESKDNTIILRSQQLANFGIQFSDVFTNITFSNFEMYAGSFPMFKQGILSSNGEGDVSKGQVLIAFLTYLKQEGSGYVPKVIIMVDDRKKHLLDVEEKLKTFDPSIQFIGIEYQGAYSYAPQDISKEDFQKFWENLAIQARAEAKSYS